MEHLAPFTRLQQWIETHEAQPVLENATSIEYRAEHSHLIIRTPHSGKLVQLLAGIAWDSGEFDNPKTQKRIRDQRQSASFTGYTYYAFMLDAYALEVILTTR